MKRLLQSLLVCLLAAGAINAHEIYSSNSSSIARKLVCTDCVDGSDLADTITLDAPLTVQSSSVTISSHVSVTGLTTLSGNVAVSTNLAVAGGISVTAVLGIASATYVVEVSSNNGTDLFSVSNAGNVTAPLNSAAGVMLNGDQTIGAGATVTLNYSRELFDYQDEFANSTFTVQTAGLYSVSAFALITKVSGVRYELYIYHNATAIWQQQDAGTTLTGGNFTQNAGPLLVSAVAGDTIYARLYNAGGSPADVQGDSSSNLSGIFIRREQ